MDKPNKYQNLAVKTTEGPLLIIAGPGSGKTFTLVERIVYLIAKKKVQPESIFVATFTEKAAMELISRVSNRMLELGFKVNLNEMYIGTLHSIFLRILEENLEFTRLSRNYRVLDDFDQKYFVYEHLNKFEKIPDSSSLMGNHNQSRWDKAEELIKRISKVSEEVLDVEDLLQSGDTDVIALAECYKLYSELLEIENSLDFSTIQTEALSLLENNVNIRKDLQKKISYLLVDEYQDTNTVQEKILFQLMNPKTQNICVVGDDDQGLYRFRGASIRNILEFRKNFTKGECKVIKLETNYRSHPQIIDFYNRWMAELDWKEDKTTFRHVKKIEPEQKIFPDYTSVIKVSAEDDPQEWCSQVLNFINYLKSSGKLTDYNQIAFLFRSVKNDNVIMLAEFLEANGLKVFSPRSALLFDRDEIRHMIGALAYMFPNLLEVLSEKTTHEYDIWEYYQDCLDFFAETVRKDKKRHSEMLKWCNGMAKSHLHLTKNTDYGFSGLFYQLLQFPMFAEYLEADLNSNVFDIRATYNLAMFSKLVAKFEFYNKIPIFLVKNLGETLRKFFNQFLRFLIEGGIAEYEDFDEYAPSGCVSFMTIHQSKGLEFPVVIVGSLNLVPRKQYDDLDVILQDKYYHKKPFEPIERTKFFDFWRLFYTAFSRAQNLLVLTTNERAGHGRSPSKYFEDIYRPILQWDDKKVKLKKLTLEQIKPVNIKKEYSFTSHILLYENCPLQYKYYKEMEFSPVRKGGYLFGMLVHETIEDIHRAVLNKDFDKITDANIESWVNINYLSLSKSNHSYLAQSQIESALKHVMNYKQKQENRWDMIKDAEVDVSLVKDDYILKGKIDLIKGKDGTVEIVDFKSQKKKPDVNSPKDREELARYKRQLEVYAHIVEERTGQKVSNMHLFYTGEDSGNPYITFPNNKVDIKQTITEFDNVVEKIESKNYNMSHIKKCEELCGDCDFRYYCKVN